MVRNNRGYITAGLAAVLLLAGGVASAHDATAPAGELTVDRGASTSHASAPHDTGRTAQSAPLREVRGGQFGVAARQAGVDGNRGAWPIDYLYAGPGLTR